jgi:sugar phosphate isomerase/epimerase
MGALKLGTCNEYFEGWSIEEVFRYAAEIGYDGVEIAPFTLAPSVEEIGPERRREIRAAAAEAGVEIIGLHWLLVSPQGLYVNHPDAAIRNRTRDYFQALIRFCGDLGGRVMIIGSPKQRNVQEGWDCGETWQRTRETFEACLPLAESCGVYLCIEPLSPEQTNLLTTAEEARRLVREIDHPHFQTMVDVCSGSSESRPVADLLRDSGPHLYHVHVNDANKRGPGFGQTDFRSIIAALKALNYQRYLSVEVFDFKPDPRTIAAASLGYLRGIEAGLGD